MINRNDVKEEISSGKELVSFNKILTQQLENLVFEIDPDDKVSLKKHFFFTQPAIKKLLLFIPAVIGYLLHFPLYYSVLLSIQKIAQDHFDSIIIGLLFVLYPVYIVQYSINILPDK